MRKDFLKLKKKAVYKVLYCGHNIQKVDKNRKQRQEITEGHTNISPGGQHLTNKKYRMKRKED